ncbi:MAG: ParA family protein [Rhizobium rhizophilum]|uniref:ParA family protein n=1 Tax=Rhizobium rhizophilum TaxID=1850373 RepID=UPI00391A4974
MPVLTFANTKGGAGKTTAVLLIATELARMGLRVAVLDADPQRWISCWHQQLGANCPDRLQVVPYVSAANLEREIKRCQPTVDIVLLDLPGARSPLIAQAMGHSDYVLIPAQGSAMDAQGAANVIDLLYYLEDKAGIRIPHSVVLTRINPIITTRALQGVKALLTEKKVHLLSTPIVERAAFRDVFSCGETLYTMDARNVSNLGRAQENAQMLGSEVLERLIRYRMIGIATSPAQHQAARLVA